MARSPDGVYNPRFMSLPSRDEALALLHEHTQGDSLRRHALAVEAAMREYARHFGCEEELWALAGLLHDMDYESYPSLQDHPFKGAEILRRRDYPETLVHAVLAHAPHTGVARDSLLDRSLFACDELCGFVMAVAMVRPSRRLADVEVGSVVKKLKDKAFARNVNREEIRLGAAELQIELDAHIARVLAALKGAAPLLGL
jgi:putative nucleotidyltransferase with HDIG domain